MVARARGARVLVSEINAFRLKLASDLGFGTVNPKETDVAALVEKETGGAGADVVFEVTATAAGAEMMTKLARTRGRLVVVGIFGAPVPVDLFRFFWRELKLIGARVYEPQDFETAIELTAGGALPFPSLITDIRPLDQLEAALRDMERGGDVMKIVIRCE